jgi:hypothetical protein
MLDKCGHYKAKEFTSKTPRADRNPRKPIIRYFCDHPNSRHNGKTFTGEATCNGDISKCDIPESER